ncbi:MAG: class I SAM-dependent methyltransferase [Thermoplasmatales archaeon]|nr:class I SAM-dependent methyltransferase [Thermoplasmatales archaeon]
MLKKNSKILEIGCAEGYLLKRLEDKFETYGVDVSEHAVKIARKNAVKSRISVQDANNINFSSEKFDMVIALSILEHLRKPENCIQRCYQILKKDGILVVQVPNTESIAVTLKGKEWQGYRDKTHLSLKSPDEWVKLLKSAGFKIVKTYGDGLTDVPYPRKLFQRNQRKVFECMRRKNALHFSWHLRNLQSKFRKRESYTFPTIKKMPMLMQRIFISIPSTILFSIGVKFPLKISEGLILIAKK